MQLPARQDRRHETPLTRVDAIVTRLVAAIESLPPAPTAIFGQPASAASSPGELGRRLSAAGTPPLALVIGARHAPHLPRAAPPIHALPEEAFVEILNRRYGTDWSLLRDPELRALALPSLRADFAAYETYEYQAGPRLEAPITVLRGLRDGTLTHAEAEAWGDLTRAGAALEAIDAGHFFVDTHRAWVLGQVRRALAAA